MLRLGFRPFGQLKDFLVSFSSLVLLCLVDLLIYRYCIDILKVPHFPGFLGSLLALLEGDDQELSEA